MARRRGSSSFSVQVKGLEELEKIPGWLDGGQRRFLSDAAEEVADAIGDAAPRRSSRLAKSWRGRAISSTSAIVSSDHPAAKAQARGAFIVAKKGKALRFADGGFARFSRIPATNYDRKGLRKRGRIVRAAFARAFDHLGGP